MSAPDDPRALVMVTHTGREAAVRVSRSFLAAFRAAGTEPDAAFPWGGAIR